MEGATTPEPAGRTSVRGTAILSVVVGVVVVAALLLTIGLGEKDLWDASEGRPAESAREMRWQGDFLVQYTNGAVDLTKPPVYAWLVALSFRLTGTETEWAARIPSVLAALGILALAFALARRAAGPRAGLLAAFLLLTQARFLWQARLAELETSLALGVLLAYAALPRALDAPPGAGRWRWSLAFHASLGLAFAVKGPIALLLVVPGSVAYALVARRGRAMRSLAFLAGIPAFLVVGLSWYVAVCLRDPAALDTFLSYAKGENVGHVRNTGLEHLYYLWQYPLNALPWTPLVVLGFAAAWPARAGADARQRAVLLPAVAFAVTFGVLTCVPAKQTHYLIPIFPMGAVLAGVWADRALAARGAALGRLAAGGAGVVAAAATARISW